MREEQALTAVERLDGRHILRHEGKIEQVEVLLHPVLVRGLRDHDDITLLQEAELAVAQVRAFDQRQRAIVIRACAPAPLWELLRKLNAAQPEKMLASAVCQNEDVLAA